MLLLACGPRPTDRAPQAPTTAAAAPAPAHQPDEPQPEPTPPKVPCDGRRFADHGFLPQDTHLAVSVDTRAPDLRAALGALSRRVQRADHGLPISPALVLAQLPLSLDLLQLAAADLHLRTDEALRVLGPEGRLAWILPTRCDTAALETRAARAWALRVTREAGADVGLPEDPGRFPHAVVFLGEGTLALVAPQDAPRMRAWLTASPAPRSPLAPPPAGAHLDELQPAPIRVVFGGQGFVAGDRPPPTALRVRADGIEEIP